MIFSWLREVAEVCKASITERGEHNIDEEALARYSGFFSSLSILMANQLRGIVDNSLRTYTDFFQRFQPAEIREIRHVRDEKNASGASSSSTTITQGSSAPPPFTLGFVLTDNDRKIGFETSLPHLEAIISHIFDATEKCLQPSDRPHEHDRGISRVENKLVASVVGETEKKIKVYLDEIWRNKLRSQVIQIFQKSTQGAAMSSSLYEELTYLLEEVCFLFLSPLICSIESFLDSCCSFSCFVLFSLHLSLIIFSFVCGWCALPSGYSGCSRGSIFNSEAFSHGIQR